MAITSILAKEFRDNFKAVCDRVVNGDTVIVPRPNNQNIVVLSEAEYNRRDKALKSIEYFNKLHESKAQLESGQSVSFTIDELLAFENMTADEITAFADKRKQEER